MHADADHPHVLVFPPALFAGTLLASLALHWIWGWRLGWPTVPRMVLGGLGIAVAVWLALSGKRALKAAGTNIRPDQPTTAIVTGGPYRFSRNPLYVAMLILYLSVTIVANSVWPLVLLLPMFLVLEFGIVRREERYLAAKFGEPYLAYKARVRRWC